MTAAAAVAEQVQEAPRDQHQQDNPQHQCRQQQQQLCSVCGDRALGFNFDAVTCESCKAFFRRNAVKTKEQRCNFDGTCEVSVTTRKFCPACRLSKCLRAGMKKDWILDAAQLQQRRERARHSSPVTTQQQQQQQQQLPAERATVLLLLSADDDTADEALQPRSWGNWRPMSAVCETLLFAVRTAVDDVMDNVDSGDSNQIRSSGTTECAARETPFAITLSFVHRFVQFVKLLPEYGLISQSDMLALIKGGVFHFTLMRGACTYSLEEDSFQFESSRLGGIHRLPLDCLSQSLSAWPDGPSLLSRYRTFLCAFTETSKGDRLALTLLQLIDFYNPARPQLADMRLVDELHRGYTQLLRRYVESKWQIEYSRAVFYSLLNWLSELDRLANEFSRLAHSADFGFAKLDPLLVEVFELRRPSTHPD